MRTLILLCVVLAALACRTRPLRTAPPEPSRVSKIDIGSPSDPKRLLRGFASGNPAWRYTGRVFAVALDRPEITGTATFLEMDLVIPLIEMAAESATIKVRANGIDACVRTYDSPERRTLVCHIPEKALEKQPVEIEVEADRSWSDEEKGEERSLVVVSMALKEYEATEEYRRAQIRSSRQGYSVMAKKIEAIPKEQARELTGPFYRLPVWRDYTYQGVPANRNPFDLWMIQQIIFETRPEFVVETRTGTGAAALYYAAVFEGAQIPGKILTVDDDDRHAKAKANPLWEPRVEFHKGSAADPTIVKAIAASVNGRPVLVTVSAGSAPDVLAALRAYAPLVRPGDYIVVEGAPLDGSRSPAAERNGASAAVDQFMAGGGSRDFERDPSREAFLWTSSPGGWLKRR